jgi:iron complex outermembrane receptor protein
MFVCNVSAQTDTISSHKLKEVEITSNSNTYSNTTTMNVSEITASKMKENGGFNIADALTAVPGINQLNTGVGISKPVIRGLYGNRIQTVFSGLRFDNQQWQDEHGLGISDIGIDKVELIKGPASLLYGSEAVGGVINIIEEKIAEEGTIRVDVSTKFISNTGGNATDIGFKGNINNKNWRVRAGYESNADYMDAKNTRILNSRFDGYYLKGSFGFRKTKWFCQNNYNSSLNNFGFIMADNYNSKTLDNRYSRTMDGPHHSVFLNILSSQNIIELKNSLLKLNIGAQSNIRMEDEGGAEISLNMHLSSLIYNMQWIKTLKTKTEIIISNQGLLQNNTNYGKRVIVPDANITETGLSLFVNQNFNRLIVEAGIGGNFRSIQTFETNNLNTPNKAILPFKKQSPALNEMLGFTINASKKISLKLCASTGFRTGNLAELASNGLHEGIYQYEIGNPNLKAEQNYNTEFSFNYYSEQVYFTLNAFNNQFKNYIYLAPTNENFYGIQVFRYFQQDAQLYGGEVALTLKPTLLKGIEYNTFFSTVTGMLSNNSYLPYIPANKLHNEIKYSFKISKHLDNCYLLISHNYIFKQVSPASYETKTSDYNLFNAGLGMNINTKKQPISINLICNNLLNEYYYDHLSRFKNYGFHNIGRNIVLSIKIPFELKNKLINQ